jgi:hypothetical protein
LLAGISRFLFDIIISFLFEEMTFTILWIATDSLRFLLSETVFSDSSFLNNSFVGYRIHN